MRLDHYLQEKHPEYSRSRLQSWIKQGLVLVDGQPARASANITGTERIELTPGELPPLTAEPEDLPVEVLYEDEAVVAVNKPAGLVVHAGAGTHSGTLVNRLVHRFQALSQVGGDLRPGIVHRIDKETSGVLLVARTDAAHRALATQFSGRTVDKFYLTLVQGRVEADSGRITKPIARDATRRTRMTTRDERGRTALTDYRVLERFARHSFLEIKIGTGRTHQIRVHMSSLGHPVAGDTLYGAAPERRMFLHAWRISFSSPDGGRRVTVEAPIPPELQSWLDELRSGI